jgi:hypothetical protein
MLYLILLIFEILTLYLLMRRATNKIFNFVGPYIFALIFLPGTFIHEMSHFLTALFLLVPVGQIELMPKLHEDGLKLGSVPIGKTDPIRRTLIGIAPIVLGLVIIFVTNTLTIPWFIHAYIAFQIGNSMFSSKKDMEGAWIIFIILIAITFKLNINPEIFKMADLFLIVPIGIDALIFFF